ncbi:MAG: DNA polymerase IV [Clostridia bacterium]|nr:DNA polymerase IV [Clostridia bacterium]
MNFLHVDLNSFFAHCAVVTSEGRYTFDTPLIVGGDASKRHGIVLAATYTVKKHGVRAGMPLREALARCPEAILVPAQYHVYSHYSDRFLSIVKRYSPVVSRYGIDEAYIDYRGCERLFGPATEVAHIIRNRVKDELGLTVSVGVGDNPLMAKMGSDYKKPDAVTVVNSQFWRERIWPMEVSNLMYVGRSTADKLNGVGIRTIGQLASASQSMLISIFGTTGKQLWLHANGIDKQLLPTANDEQKSISASCTLPGDIQTESELFSALLRQTDKVAYRLRKSGMRALVVGVSVRYSDLSHRSKQTRLLAPTDVTGELYECARELIRSLYGAKPIRQVGMRVASLISDSEQLSIFQDALHEKRRKLDVAVDALRTRYGGEVISRASTLHANEEPFENFNPFDRNTVKE